jgi:membrane protein DedA with SNARE-associated domain
VPEHSEIVRILAFIERHGYALLFFWVLGEQSAIPVPSVPLLLAAGALIRGGRLAALPAVLCCVIAALVADTVWFQLGRHRGRQVLRLVCRLSLEPDSCVRQTENTFLKYGMRSLLVSKFIPGLNAVAAPLAGHSRTSYRRFALYDCAGSAIWSGAYLGLGYVFSNQLERAVGYASRMGSNLVVLVAGVFALWLAWKWIERRRFLRQLDVARITPAELQALLDAGEEPFIVDLRSGLADSAPLIPGAVRISPEELAARGGEIPRDREIILFCT